MERVGEFRNSRASKDLKDWLEYVNLPYHSPHKFRHGNAVFSIKRAKDIHALKAISQNLMHSNLSVTDGIYGILNEYAVRVQIVDLGKKFQGNEKENGKNLIPLLEKLLKSL